MHFEPAVVLTISSSNTGRKDVYICIYAWVIFFCGEFLLWGVVYKAFPVDLECLHYGRKQQREETWREWEDWAEAGSWSGSCTSVQKALLRAEQQLKKVNLKQTLQWSLGIALNLCENDSNICIYSLFVCKEQKETDNGGYQGTQVGELGRVQTCSQKMSNFWRSNAQPSDCSIVSKYILHCILQNCQETRS